MAVVVAGAYAALIPLRAGDHAYYLVTPSSVVAVFIGAAVAMAAGELIWWRYGGPFALLGATSAALLLGGALLIFSVGLPLFVAGVVVLLLSLAMARRQHAHAGLSVASGAALAVGLGIVVFQAVVRPPLVDCRAGGGISTSGLSSWGGGSMSASLSGSDGRASGAIRQGGQTVEFVCLGGRLVELRRLSRGDR